MATISDIKTTPLSGLNHIDALLDSGPDWNFLTPAGNVLRYTFSIASGNESNTTGQEAFTASQQAATRSALAYIASLTGIQFVETANGTDADIHLSNLNLTPGNVTGLCSWHSNYGYSGNQLTSYMADAYVYLDNVEWRGQNMNLAPGTEGYETLLHELGHALGLKHPFETIGDNAAQLTAEDNTAYTLMSYTDVGGPYSTYQPYDVAALNWLYGGDGLRGALGINSTAGGRYITGTSGADTLTGTAANDKLEGDGGNDMIDGGAGTDTAVFRGARSNYTFSPLANGDVQVTARDGLDGTDILRSIELYQFGSDGAVRADTVLGDTTPPAAPQLVVTRNGNGYVSNKNPSVTGSAEANATVKIYTTDNVLVGTAVTDANGLWTAKLDAFADGLNYKIYAVAIDASGNTSTSSAIAAFNVDATAPLVPTASLSFSAGANTATLRGTGEAGTEIQLWRLGATIDDAVDIAHATVGADGTWSIGTSPLPNGQYSLRPVSIDKAGNATSADTLLTLTVDSSLNLAGGAANDRLVAPGAGDNAIDGQAGLDTVVYAGARNNYTVAKEVWGYGVTDKAGNGGHDAVLNVERLAFSDGNIALDVDGNAGQIYRLYQAVFGRAAEETGLGYWISAMDTSYTLKGLADLFMHQKEFDQLYGTAPTDAEFVTKLYTNVLHRAAEGAGYDFWMNSLGLGTSRVDVIVAFSESTENQAQVIGSIQDGMKYVPYHVG